MNHDRLFGVAPVGSHLFYFGDHVAALQDHAKHFILTVQPLRFDGIDEPLRPIRVGPAARVGHAQEIPAIVFHCEGLVFKFPAAGKDAFSSRPVAVREIATLDLKRVRNEEAHGDVR